MQLPQQPKLGKSTPGFIQQLDMQGAGPYPVILLNCGSDLSRGVKPPPEQVDWLITRVIDL